MTKQEGREFLKRVYQDASLSLDKVNGDGVRAVADAIGVSRATLYHWLNRSSPGAIPVRMAFRLAALAKIDAKEFIR